MFSQTQSKKQSIRNIYFYFSYCIHKRTSKFYSYILIIIKRPIKFILMNLLSTFFLSFLKETEKIGLGSSLFFFNRISTSKKIQCMINHKMLYIMGIIGLIGLTVIITKKKLCATPKYTSIGVSHRYYSLLLIINHTVILSWTTR